MRSLYRNGKVKWFVATKEGKAARLWCHVPQVIKRLDRMIPLKHWALVNGVQNLRITERLWVKTAGRTNGSNHSVESHFNETVTVSGNEFLEIVPAAWRIDSKRER